MTLRSRISKDLDNPKTNVEIFESDQTRKKDNRNETLCHQRISWQWPIYTIVLCCVLYYLVHYNDHVLPKVVTVEELASNKNIFSGEQSRIYLRKFTNLGPRVVGNDANEIHTPNVIMEEAEKIIRQAKSIHSIKMERQVGSGAYTMAYTNRPWFVNVYDNISNVIIMFEGSIGDHSILLNCHYDSVPEVEGGSDDAISCAVMLEILRAISNDDARPKHNIIFLFNGAEEVGLQASHLFLQHVWSNKTRIFINLEAAGSGGREMLFQSGPKTSWIFNYYAKYAPHPHSQVLVEEMFQEGVIPSDTDFRIFRDFKNLRGLDFAFGRNGYVYHTKYDKEIYIPLGSHQHMGDNVLAILRPLANAPELEDMENNSDGQVVFFDYLGWFMISYSVEVGIAINITAVLLTVCSFVILIKRLRVSDGSDKKYSSKKLSAKATICELSIALVSKIVGMVLSIGAVVALAYIINSTALLSMVWFSNVWLIFPLYWCPCLIIGSLVPHLVTLWRSKVLKISPTVVTQINLVASQVPHMLGLLILTCAGYRSSSVLFLPVLSAAAANIVINVIPLYRTAHLWTWTYIIIQAFSFIMSLYFILIAYIILIPIMGRQGVVNAELYIGIVSAILCIFLTAYLLPLMALVKRSYIVYILLSLFTLIALTLAVNTDVGFPYKAGPEYPAPQRYWVMHTQRELRNDSNHIRRSEAGYFILNLDMNSPKTIPMKERSIISSLESDCKEELFCGLPMYSTRYVPLIPLSNWIPGSPPTQPATTSIILKNKSCQNNECSLYFSLKGSTRLTLTFAPRTGATLLRWSLPAEPVESIKWKGNPAYLLHICRGLTPADIEIMLTFKVSDEQRNGNPILDIALASNHVHHEKYRTEEYQQFLSSFPDWTDRVGWISDFKSYVF